MAGTVVETFSQNGPMAVVTLTLTGDASDGTIPDTALTTKMSGRLVCIVTNPGTPAPTSNYDLVLNDADGIDMLKGAGANRHASNSEASPIEISANNRAGVPVAAEDTLTLVVTNQSVAAASIVIKLYVDGVLRVNGQ